MARTPFGSISERSDPFSVTKQATHVLRPSDLRSATTHPDPHTVVNTYPRQWVGFYIMSELPISRSPGLSYIYGFFLGCLNIFVWYMYFVTSIPYHRNNDEASNSAATHGSIAAKITSPGPKARRIYHWLVAPIAIVMCLGPFFSPWAGLKLTQWHVWSHKCDLFEVEAILIGRGYYSEPSELDRAIFYFWENRVRTKYYEYGLNGTNHTYHFTLTSVAPGVNIPSQVYPLVQNVTYDTADGTISASCAASSETPANTTACMEGSYKLLPDQRLEITTNDTRTHTVAILRTTDNWSFDKSVDAPNFIFKDVLLNGTESNITALQSVVTKPGGCNFLKVCLARETGVEMVVALGLALFPQGAYAHACTSPSSG